MKSFKYVIKAVFTVFIVFAAVLIFGGNGSVAKAGNFDAAYYAAKYPDVVEVFGTDPNALYAHYLNYGIKELRYKNATEEATGVIEDISMPSDYVDVDIINQQMVYYQQGVAVLSSSIVTGNPNNGNSTPTGVYYIDTKVPGKYLTGPTWHVWVDRWMKFNGSIGLHDATWRSEFGGEIYKKNGSHGCVNLPHDVATALYDYVNVGTMVVVH